MPKDVKAKIINIGQINLAEKTSVKLQNGAEGSIFRRSLLVFEGQFSGMFGPITVTQDLLSAMVERFNREYANPKNIHDYPPTLVDHDRRADSIKGRLIPELVLEDWNNPRTGETVKAIFGPLRVDDKEAQEKVEAGVYSQLSVSFDDSIENLGEIYEVSFVAVEAARGAQILEKGENRMDLAQVNAKLESKNKNLKSKLKEYVTLKKASCVSMSQNLEAALTHANEIQKGIVDNVKNLRMMVLKKNFEDFIREGRLTKAEYDKIKFDEVIKMSADGKKQYLSSFQNRPMSADLIQHGMTGAKPLSEKGMQLSGAEMRQAIKAQKEGKNSVDLGNKKLRGVIPDDEGRKLADHEDDEENTPAPSMTVEELEEALTKLESLTGMVDKIKEAEARMRETLKKLQGEEDKEDNDDEEE